MVPVKVMSDTIVAPGKGRGPGKPHASQSESVDRKEGIGAYSGVGTATEPLARLSDIEEFRSGYAKLKAGEWDVGKWQGYRLRFGVYGQLQPNVHMIRIKIPGGVLSFDWSAGSPRPTAVGAARTSISRPARIFRPL